MNTNSDAIVTVDGQQLTAKEIRINQDMDTFHSFEVLVDARDIDPGTKQSSEEVAPSIAGMVSDFVGKNLQIAIRLNPVERSELSFTGTITNLRVNKEGTGSDTVFVLAGNGLPVSMNGAPQVNVFSEMSLMDIVNEKLGAYSSIETTKSAPGFSSPMEYIVQYNENDWAFIRRLCMRFGAWFFYDGTKLHFGALPQGAGNAHELVYKDNLGAFSIGMLPGASKMEAAAWDYKTMQQVTKKFDDTEVSGPNPYYSAAKDAGEALFPTEGQINGMQSNVFNNQDAELAAEVAASKKNMAKKMTVLEGKSTEPGLKPGDKITVSESLSDGSTVDYQSYIVNSVVHERAGNFYSNTFTAYPEETMAPTYSEATPYCEKQSATVVENHDADEQMNRVKVEFPWSKGTPTPWLRMMTGTGGAEQGFTIIPEIGEEVLVDFEKGNPEKPIVMGSLYNGQAKSGLGDADNNIKCLKTRSGHALTLDDTDGAEKITLEDPNGNTLVINTAEDTITITGKQAINLSAKEITINGEDKVSISSKEISLNGTQKVEALSNTEVSLDSTGSLTLSGAQSAELSSPMMVDVKGQTAVNVSGLVVNLNS